MCNTNETKTKTCPRCNGTGTVTSPVVHMGVSGGCFQCNMKGIVRWASREELNEGIDKRVSKRLIEIQQNVDDKKEFFGLLRESNHNTNELERYLESMRHEWRQAKNNLGWFAHVKRGKWIAL